VAFVFFSKLATRPSKKTKGMKVTQFAKISLFSLLLISSAKAFETAQSVTATPITTLPFTITASGNYYLPANLTFSAAGSAIIVEADEVVIDLNGRSLVAAGAAKSFGVGIGILCLNHEDVIIQNGDINGFGYIGILFDASDKKREHNQKNDARRVNFNGDTIGVLTISGSINKVENCDFDGGSVGIYDIASLGGDRFQQDNFENQKPVEAMNASIGVLVGPGAGTLTEDCLVADDTDGIVLGSGADKFRFDSFNSVTTHVIGGTEENAGDL
jgi:hypothetical protein